jgi:hypothetical protein
MSAWTDDELRRILQRLGRSDRPPGTRGGGHLRQALIA